MDSRTITITRDISKDVEFVPASWGDFTISQVLLPVLGSVFVTVVIVTIACCLIKRNTKSTRRWRERSCHTIETSHDTSDQDIYDVIDDVSIAPDSTEKRQWDNKLSSNYFIGSQHLLHSKVSDSSSSLGFQYQTSSYEALRQTPCSLSKMTFLNKEITSGAPERPHCYVSPKDSQTQDDERIYETLDSHWTPVNERREHKLFHNPDQITMIHHQNMHFYEVLSNRILQSSVHDSLRCKSKCYKSYCNSHCQRTEPLNRPTNPCVINSSASSYKLNENNTLLCQLSMFKLNRSKEPTLVDQSFYHIQSQITPHCCGRIQDVSANNQNSSIKLVQQDLKEAAPESHRVLDLILNPLKENDFLQHENDKSLTCDVYGKPAAANQTSLANDGQYPGYPVNKCENSRSISSNFNGFHDPNPRYTRKSECYNVAALPDHSHHRKPYDASRISAMLGPLPPLPFQNYCSCSRKELTTSNKYSYLHNQESQVQSSELRQQNSKVVHSLFSPPVCDSCHDFDVSRQHNFCDVQQETNPINNDFFGVSRRVGLHQTTITSNPYTISTGNVYQVDKTTVCENVRGGQDSVHGNDYFVLESPSEFSNNTKLMSDC